MKINRKTITTFSFVILLLVACSSLGNPFVGDWVSGAFNLEFKSDKTFELTIGKAVSVNMQGTYKYDKETLTLDLEGDSDLVFSYEFKDGDKTLVLVPDNESSYINTKIEFTRK